MGMLIDGQWVDDDTIIHNGDFKRPETGLDRVKSRQEMARIAADVMTSGRYYLITSMSCPWSQRVNLLRIQKELQPVIPVQIAGGRRVQGYPVNNGNPWRVPGSAVQIRHLHQLYSLGHPSFTGRATVPVLWDAQDQRIISNESSDLIRFLNALDDRSGGNERDFFPAVLAAEIDEMDRWLYENLSNAAYRAGFARTQSAYDDAVSRVFATLDALETRLKDQRFLLGNVLTGADWLLLPALLRFDIAYYSHFRCTRRRLVDYPALWAYARDLYQLPGVAETVDFSLIQKGYWQNDGDNNPHGIVPLMPDMDWCASHDRNRFGEIMVYASDGCDRPYDACDLVGVG